MTHSYLIVVLDLQEGTEEEAGEQRRRWNARFGRPAGQQRVVHTQVRDPDRPLRVGYVSPSLFGHPVGRSMLPILAHYDRERFEVVLYHDAVAVDTVTKNASSSKSWFSC